MTNGVVKASKRKKQDQSAAWRWVLAQVVTLTRQFGGTIIWAGVVVYLIHESAVSLQAFAGRTSVASIFVDLAERLNATVTLSVSLAGVTSGLLLFEHRRHRKTRERLTGRITELEKKIDPNRSSSQLTTEGTTSFGDL